jgi:hypothetical protein
MVMPGRCHTWPVVQVLAVVVFGRNLEASLISIAMRISGGNRCRDSLPTQSFFHQSKCLFDRFE